MATRRKRKTTRRRRNPARALLVNPRRRRRTTRKRRNTRRRRVYARQPRRRTYRRRRNARKRRSTRRSPVIVYRNAPKKRVTRRRRRRRNPSVKNLVYMALSAGGGFLATRWATEKVMEYFPTLYQYPIVKPAAEFGASYLLYKYGKKLGLPVALARAAAVGAGAAAVVDAVQVVMSGNLLPMTASAVSAGQTAAQGALMGSGMGALLPAGEAQTMGALMSSDLGVGMGSMGMM